MTENYESERKRKFYKFYNVSNTICGTLILAAVGSLFALMGYAMIYDDILVNKSNKKAGVESRIKLNEIVTIGTSRFGCVRLYDFDGDNQVDGFRKFDNSDSPNVLEYIAEGFTQEDAEQARTNIIEGYTQVMSDDLRSRLSESYVSIKEANEMLLRGE